MNNINIKSNTSEIMIKKIFDDYNSGKMPLNISNSYLETLLKDKNKLYKLPKKIMAINKMVERIEKGLNTAFINSGTRFVLSSTTTISADIRDGNIKTKISLFELGDGESSIVNIPLNINIKTLLDLPPEEVYAILKGLVYHAVLCNKMDKSEENHDKDFENVLFYRDQEEKKDLKEHVKEKANKEKAKSALKKYFMGLFENYFSKDFKKFDNIAELVANDIVSTMDPSDIRGMLGTFFDMSKFKKEGIEKVEEFLNSDYKTLSMSRESLILSKAKNKIAEPGKEIEAINYQKQYKALLSVNTKEKFAEMKNSINDENKIRDFCVEYINNYMSSNGLEPLEANEITFNNVGGLGLYSDNGVSRSININLSKINSITELVMTLSHELTHAKKSITNQSRGVFDRDTGSGLVGGMDEDISNSGLEEGSDELKFLVKLENYCYHLDPNEREGRIGEMSALGFMKELAPERQDEIEQSISGYLKYQQRTIDIKKALLGEEVKGNDLTIQEINRIFKQIKDKLPERAKNLIEERVNYLNNLVENKSQLDMSEEDKSKEIVASMSQREDVIRQQQENMIKQEELKKQNELENDQLQLGM